MKRLVLCLLLLLPFSAHAATPYIVPGVAVDVTADSAAAARNEAITEGARKAFMNLATQLVPGRPIPDVTDRQIGDMVSDFSVEREQFGANRYVGVFTFRFRQNPVRAAFGSQYIPSPAQINAQMNSTAPIVLRPPATAAAVQAAAAQNEAANLIQSEAANAAVIAPEDSRDVPLVAPLPTGVDMNSPIKMMLIEAAPVDALDKIRAAPGVVNLSFAGPTLNMAYRGDTSQLMDNLRGQGVNLELKVPTQPPIYTIAQ